MQARFSLLTLLAVLASGQALAADASNGQTVYSANCASCHGGGNGNWTLANIQSAIQGNRGGMSSLSALSSSDLQDIVAYLSSTAASTGSTGSTTGSATSPAITTAPTPDALFTSLESAFLSSFGSHDATTVIAGYSIRYYPSSGLYLGVLANQLYLYDSNRSTLGVIALGSTIAWANELASSTAVAATNSLSKQLAAILAGSATRMTALFGGPSGLGGSDHGREHGRGGRN